MLRRAFDRFSGLNLAQKVLAALLAALSAALLLFSLSFFISTAILNLLGVGEQADPPSKKALLPKPRAPAALPASRPRPPTTP